MRAHTHAHHVKDEFSEVDKSEDYLHEIQLQSEFLVVVGCVTVEAFFALHNGNDKVGEEHDTNSHLHRVALVHITSSSLRASPLQGLICNGLAWCKGLLPICEQRWHGAVRSRAV